MCCKWQDVIFRCSKLFVETLYRDGKVSVQHIPTNTNKYGYMIRFYEADHLDEAIERTLQAMAML